LFTKTFTKRGRKAKIVIDCARDFCLLRYRQLRVAGDYSVVKAYASLALLAPVVTIATRVNVYSQ
jgi:hypothetical protein